MFESMSDFLMIALGVVVLLCVFLFVVPAILRGVIVRRTGDVRTMNWRDRVELRYRSLPFYYWMFARYKLRMDPMFGELPQFIAEGPGIERAIDIGCGYGVPGCVLQEFYADLRIYGIEPNARRARVAGRVFGERGQVWPIAAPWNDAPPLPEIVDLVTVIDVIHYLPDEELDRMLRQIRARMTGGGRLILRAAMPRPARATWSWRSGAIDRWMHRTRLSLRSKESVRSILDRTGFAVEQVVDSGNNKEMAWFAGRAR